MKQQQTDRNRRLRAEALTALWLDSAPPAPGKRPELDELAAWAEGKVAEPRSSEIRAHVARDPACFRDWADLRQVQQELDGVAAGSRQDKGAGVAAGLASKLGQWLRPHMAGGLAAAALVLLVLTLGPQLIRPPGLMEQVGEDYAALRWDVPPDSGVWPRPVGLVSKSLGGLWTDPVQARQRLAPAVAEAFGAGVRRGLERLTRGQRGWERVIDTLPRAACGGAAAAKCSRRQGLLQAAGQWTVLQYLSCRKGVIDREQARKGRERARAFAERLAPPAGSTPLVKGFAQWAQPGDTGDQVAAYCAHAQRVLRLGLDS